jgi:two-component system probable response regulator PhcQ
MAAEGRQAAESDMTMRHLLLVDDEPNVLNALVRALKQHLSIGEVAIETFVNPFDALNRCCEHDFDVVISDYRMPEMTGVDFLQALKNVAPCTVRMILSASTEFETVTAAINDAQVFRYIPKPWQVDDLKENIRLALIQRDLLVEEERLAAAQRAREAALSPVQIEAQLLEEEEPGILAVKWGANGEILL